MDMKSHTSTIIIYITFKEGNELEGRIFQFSIFNARYPLYSRVIEMAQKSIIKTKN